MFTLFIIFWKERRAANPSRKFRVALREKVDALLPPETRTEHRYAAFRRVALGFAVMFPVLLGGTSAYAYSSASVTEGSALYPVKRGLESVQLRFRTDPNDLATYRLRLYERRLDEAEQLLESRDAMIETLNAAVEMNDILESLEQFDGQREEIRKHLKQNQERYKTVRLRAYVEGASGEPSLKMPSFMIRSMQE